MDEPKPSTSASGEMEQQDQNRPKSALANRKGKKASESKSVIHSPTVPNMPRTNLINGTAINTPTSLVYFTKPGYNSRLSSTSQTNQLHSSSGASTSAATNPLSSPSGLTMPSQSVNRSQSLYSKILVPVRLSQNLPSRSPRIEPISTASLSSNATVSHSTPNANSNGDQVNYKPTITFFTGLPSNSNTRQIPFVTTIPHTSSIVESSSSTTTSQSQSSSNHKEIKTEDCTASSQVFNVINNGSNPISSTPIRTLLLPTILIAQPSITFNPLPNPVIYQTSISTPFSSVNSQSASENSNEDPLLASKFLDVVLDENTGNDTSFGEQVPLVILSKQNGRYVVQWTESGQQEVFDEAFLQKEYPVILKRFLGKPKKSKRKKPKLTKTQARMLRQQKAEERLALQAAEEASRPVYRYNPNYRVVNYSKGDSNRITYEVDKRGKGMRTMSSKTARKVCPINLIHFLESKIHIRKSLPFETVVKCSQQLNKY